MIVADEKDLNPRSSNNEIGLKEREATEFATSTDTIVPSAQDKRKAKIIVYKNLFIVGLAWVFFFTAYSSIASLQSSLNSEAGLGVASLSTIYVSLIISCIFLPTLMIKRFGTKWTIVIAQFCYIAYIAANLYPRFYTLVPTAVILGCI